MLLTDYEKALLHGDYGQEARQLMEIMIKVAELNEAVLRRFELNALVQRRAVDRRDVAVKAKEEGWVEPWVERDYVPAALSGLDSYQTMNAAWDWCRQQGYIPNRTS